MANELMDGGGGGSSPLDLAEHLFRLVAAGGGSLAVDGAALSPELPQRQVPLKELRHLLATRSVSTATTRLVWRELAIRVQGGEPRWAVAAAGVAVPLLRGIAADSRAAAGRAGVEGKVLAGFSEALRTVDPRRPDLVAFLYDAARTAGERVSTASARGRVSSDPQPIHIREKGDRGVRTGPARNHTLRHRRRLRGCALVVGVAAVLLAGTAIAAVAEAAAVALPRWQPKPPAGTAELTRVFTNLRNWLTGLLAALATLMLTIGGVRYLVAGGDPGEVQKGKAALKAAAFGYSLAVLAPLFMNVLRHVVGG
ncbi:hypothetical protein [Spongiactinospora rosea]|uniref:hypothetical protein n=1 Tax=Spongiactinospora rosea TaxID=2248750 RepID=UPI0018F57696|nr:hypothetical protein [Spongiactinospora rosea]